MNCKPDVDILERAREFREYLIEAASKNLQTNTLPTVLQPAKPLTIFEQYEKDHPEWAAHFYHR